MARPDQLVGKTDAIDADSSRNCNIDPFTGGVSRRMGCEIQGDTVSSALEVTGLLASKWEAKSRKFVALDSPSISTKFPVPAILYGNDTNAGFPTSDSGWRGTIYYRDTNVLGSNNSLLSEFSSNHYAQTYSAGHTSSNFNLKVVPICYESGDGVYNRGATTGVSGADQFMQQLLTCGSRSLLQTQSWCYFPNLRATPFRWNKRFNDGIGGGSEVVRIWPTGPWPPLFPPTATTPSSSTSGTSWKDGDTYFISVAFQFEDGSYSLPFIPRAPGPTLTSGLGVVTVGTVGGTAGYRYMAYSNIPIGPEGTTARVILRSLKQQRTATTDTITVAPLDLRVVGVLKNNTQTSFNDFGGDDDSLVEDDDVVRLDLICPRRARYIGTGDQRAIVSYTLPNTAAIILAPTGGSESRQFNTVDTAAINYANGGFFVRITSTQLELHHNDGVAPNFTSSTGNAADFPFATYPTLQELVDAINTTLVTLGAGNEADEWAAQLAPGIDGTMPSASLTRTTFDLTATSTLSSTTLASSAAFGSVGIGMKVSGGGISAGTYVVSKASASSLTLSTAAGVGAGAGTFTFYQETGDNGIVAGGTVGYMRAFGPNYPLVLHMKPSAFPNYDKPDKQSVYYTMASPGALTSGVSLAPNSFLAGNRALPHSSPRQEMARIAMGIVDVEGAAVVAYTDGIYLFKNFKGGNSGEDFDCRLYTINDGRGCISYLGLVSGNGWAAYPSTEGVHVTDKNGREFSIAGDIFNASDGTGDLAQEISASSISAASDSDDQHLSMAVMGSKLYLSYRSENVAHTTHYDFSPGIEASGVEEVLNPETKSPYIWSPPSIYNLTLNAAAIGAMGSVIGSGGRSKYICFDTNNGATGDGRFDKIDTGTTDNASSYTAEAVPAPFAASQFHALSPQRIECAHLTTTGTASVQFANNQTPTFNVSLLRSLNVDANRIHFQKQAIPIDQGQRGKTDLFWTKWVATVAPTTSRVWWIALQYGEVENDVAMLDLV